MDTLKPGLKGTAELTVAREHCTSRGGGPWVFMTPAMVQFCEQSCHKLVMPLVAAGQNTVGTIVYIKHLAPTPEGMKVRAEMELIEVDRRRLKFKVQIFDEMELVGECEHERFVIDVDKAGERLRKKIEAMKR
jgi:fluoroacetyl-CoA thioesterase